MRTPARWVAITASPGSGRTATHTTTDPPCGDRSPRSPRHANALGYPSGGFSFPAFAKRVLTIHSTKRARSIATRTVSRCRFSCTHPLPQHPAANVRTSRSWTGRAVADFHHEAHPCCVAMLDAGGSGKLHDKRRAHGLPVGDSRQCEASIERYPAVWACVPSGARGPAVAYARCREKVFRQDVRPGWAADFFRRLMPPVRFRNRHHLERLTVRH